MRARRFLSVLAVLVALCDLCQAADFFIWDGDQNHNSGLELRATLVRAGYDGAYDTTIAPYLGSLPNYRAIFLCMGVFPEDCDLTEEPVAVDSLVSYLTNCDSTNIYLEGGQEWTLNRYHNLNPYFYIEGLANGFGDTDTVLGQAGVFTEGMAFDYSGDNAFMDRLGPLSTAFVIFRNNNPVYDNGIAYDNGDPSYRTIGTSFEFSGLVEGVPPSTRRALVDSIMHFFRIYRRYYDWDAAVVSIDMPDWVVPNQPLTPRAVVMNVGLNAATFGVTCTIDGYTGTDTVYDLAPDSARAVAFFPDWVPGSAGTNYTVTVYTGLVGDQRALNDTLRVQVTSWDDRWYIISPFYRGTPPTMDGRMSAGEWDSAEVRDVSDFLGHFTGTPRPPGSAYLYVMNDTGNAYIALDAWEDLSNWGGDRVELWFEDNHDSSWPQYPDSTEGNLTMITHPDPVGPWFEFWPWMSTGPPQVSYAVGVAGWAGSHAGHMQFELTIPFGTANHHLNASPGDTVGLWLNAVDSAPRIGYAWWPTSSEVGGFDLADHGDLIFSTGSAIVHDGGVDSIASPPDTVWPSSIHVPGAVVRNSGNVAEICTVNCIIVPGGYSSEVTAYLGPDSSALVNFAPWQVPPLHTTYLMRVRIAVVEDENPGNDTLSKHILVYHHDGGVESILSPADTVLMGDTLNVQATIRNYGTLFEDSIQVKCTIDGWEDSNFLFGLAPGELDTATFANWVPPDTGLWTMTVYTLVSGDTDPANDTLSKEIYVRPTGVEESLAGVLIPRVFGLSQNYPNPFGQFTSINYQLPKPVSTTLRIYDISGRLVRTLVDGEKEPGSYSVSWDGKSENGLPVAGGVYIYRLIARHTHGGQARHTDGPPQTRRAGGQARQTDADQAEQFSATKKLVLLE